MNKYASMNPIPSRPLVSLSTKGHALEQYDGKVVTLSQIAEDCGGMSTFHCEVEIEGTYPRTISAEFIQVDTSSAPETHKHPEAAKAWVLCRYRDEAWEMGEFAPPETL